MAHPRASIPADAAAYYRLHGGKATAHHYGVAWRSLRRWLLDHKEPIRQQGARVRTIDLVRRYLKSRAVSDETYSEYSQGWDDAMAHIEEQLLAENIPHAWRDITKQEIGE